MLRVRRGKDEPQRRVRIGDDPETQAALEEAAIEDDPEEEEKQLKS